MVAEDVAAAREALDEPAMGLLAEHRLEPLE
jgi:hypothetical protein